MLLHMFYALMKIEGKKIKHVLLENVHLFIHQMLGLQCLLVLYILLTECQMRSQSLEV